MLFFSIKGYIKASREFVINRVTFKEMDEKKKNKCERKSPNHIELLEQRIQFHAIRNSGTGASNEILIYLYCGGNAK